MTFQRVCSVGDVPEDTNVLGLEIDGEPVAIVRDSGGELHAINNVCSHQYVLLSEGEVEDCSIECWLHGSRFDLRTGAPTGLPATQPIDVYAIQVDGDDVLIDLQARPDAAALNTPVNATKEN